MLMGNFCCHQAYDGKYDSNYYLPLLILRAGGGTADLPYSSFR